MNVVESIKRRVADEQKRIVLPEVSDQRVIAAAARVSREGFARIVLPGEPTVLEAAVRDAGADLSRIGFLDSSDASLIEKLAAALYERRKHRSLSMEKARRLVRQPTYAGALMVQCGLVDGMVAGSVATSANLIRSAVHCVGPAEGLRTVSSCFLMVLPRKEFGDDGVMLYADCGCVPDPDVEQLCDIAVAAAQSYELFTGNAARIAMLSFSTKGSAHHHRVEKMAKAAEKLHERSPGLAVDGELQLDAAVVPSVAERKAPGSVIGGRANILIFPDLNAGNICYKMTERFGGATAIGPVLMGLAKPINDLSRGCPVEAIVGAVAITATQALAVKPEV